jgi:hypothetical protein
VRPWQNDSGTWAQRPARASQPQLTSSTRPCCRPAAQPPGRNPTLEDPWSVGIPEAPAMRAIEGGGHTYCGQSRPYALSPERAERLR